MLRPYNFSLARWDSASAPRHSAEDQITYPKWLSGSRSHR